MQFDFNQTSFPFFCKGSSASTDNEAIFTNCKMLRDFGSVKKDSEWNYIRMNKHTVDFCTDYTDVIHSIEYGLSFEERKI